MASKSVKNMSAALRSSPDEVTMVRGTVEAVWGIAGTDSRDGFTVDVEISGSGSITPGLTCSTGFSPNVGDIVWVVMSADEPWVLCRDQLGVPGYVAEFNLGYDRALPQNMSGSHSTPQLINHPAVTCKINPGHAYRVEASIDVYYGTSGTASQYFFTLAVTTASGTYESVYFGAIKEQWTSTEFPEMIVGAGIWECPSTNPQDDEATFQIFTINAAGVTVPVSVNGTGYGFMKVTDLGPSESGT